MQINNGDLFAVKFCQKILGRDVCMVWTITTKNPAGAIDLIWLLNKIKEHFNVAFIQLQHTSVQFQSIRIDGITNPILFAEVPWTGGGGVTGEAMPPFVAYSIRLLRGNKTTRMGFKRVPGVVENANQGGNITDTYLVDVELLASKFGLPADFSDVVGSVRVEPVIVGRKRDGRFDTTRVQSVKGYQVVRTLTTQNTRKT